MKYMLRIILISLIYIFTQQSLSASQYKNVNILTWWGYIDISSEIIKSIETTCNAKISVDDYYSNSEFIERLSQTDTTYDILIYSKIIFNSIKSKVAKYDSDLYTISSKYYPIFKEKYVKSKLPHNTVYFQIAPTGFLYNPEKLHILESDSIEKIFKNAHNNIIDIVDDEVEANHFISSLMKKNNFQHQNLNAYSLYSKWEIFNKLFKGKKVFITNNINQIVSKENFAFAFTWSGDAIQEIMKTKNHLKFFVHPTLSYLTSDLLSVISNKPEVNCVAQNLSGEKFLNFIQDNTFYFSPFMPKSTSNNPYFNALYNDTIKKLPTLPWADNITKEDFDEIKHNWDFVKYKQELSNGSI